VKVVINALSALQGGGQVYLINLLKRLKYFPSITVYILVPPKLVDVYKFPGVKTIACSIASKSVIHRTLWEKIALPNLLRNIKAQILFCPGGILNTNLPKGCSSVVSFQNMLPFSPSSYRKYRYGYQRLRLWLLRRTLVKSMKIADRTIFISKFARDFIEQLIPNIRTHSLVIPHGISDEFRRKSTNLPDILKGKQYFLYVSMFDVYKCQVEVVKAYAKLRKMRDTPEVLVLVGPTRVAAYAKQVDSEIEKEGLSQYVLRLGELPQQRLPCLYHNAKAIIFASKCENCPNILLESLAAAKPLFVSNQTAMPELAGDAAVYFDPDNPEELTGLLVEYLDNKSWMDQMGRKAYERSLLYSWEKTARETFQEMLKLNVGNSI